MLLWQFCASVYFAWLFNLYSRVVNLRVLNSKFFTHIKRGKIEENLKKCACVCAFGTTLSPTCLISLSPTCFFSFLLNYQINAIGKGCLDPHIIRVLFCWLMCSPAHSHNAQLVNLRGVLQVSSTVLFFQMRKMRVNGRVMKSPAWGAMKKILDLKMKSLMSLFVQRVLR